MVFHQLMKQGSAPVPRQRPPGALLLGQALVLLAILGGTVSSVLAQGGEDAALDIRLGGRGQRLELTVNTSQVLKPGKRIPRLFVANPEIIQATPLAEDEIQIAALTPGTTQLNLWDEQGQITTWDVLVSPDARQLREVLESEFPEATLRVRPLAKSVYITGYVPRPEMVHEITTLAKDYHKDVISGIVVGGVQQVALHVKVMEVSRTKLRQLGLDWEFLGEDISLNQGTGGLLAQAGLPPGGAPGNSGKQAPRRCERLSGLFAGVAEPRADQDPFRADPGHDDRPSGDLSVRGQLPDHRAQRAGEFHDSMADLRHASRFCAPRAWRRHHSPGRPRQRQRTG